MNSSFNRKVKIIERYNPGNSLYLRKHENEIWCFAPKSIMNGKLHHRPRLALSFDKNVAHDWVSGWSGKLEKALDLLNVSESDKKILLGSTYKTKNKNKDIYIPSYNNIINNINIKSNKINLNNKKYYNYLKQRSINIKDILTYNIKCNDYYDSVLFFSYDKNDNYQGFIAKNIFKDIYYNKFSYKSLFFESLLNLDKPIILTEGIFDSINIKMNSNPLLGKGVRYVIKRLKKLKFGQKIYLMLDSDVDFTIIRKLYNQLNKYFDVAAIDISKFDINDPAELNNKQVKQIVRNIRSKKYKSLNDYV